MWYLSNEKCEESEGYVKTATDGTLFGSYAGSIKDTMLCAHDRRGTTSDACQGDSGGALVRTGSDSSADLLIGLVSWGFGCADPNFPGVYSRLSAYYSDFLKPTICRYSRNPPSYLNCGGGNNNAAIVPIPTPSPQSTPDGLLTIFVTTDPFNPEDLGWELTSIPDGRIVASRPTGYYATKYRTKLQEEVIVDLEKFYRLEIYDADKDGFLGEMLLVRGRRYVKSDALVYEPGFSSVSGGSVVHGFYVGDSPERVLTLDLTFDRNPESLAWSVINVSDDLPLGFKWFDWYGKNFMTARETIPVYGNDRGSQEYIFTVLDLDGNGMCCLQGEGSFSLYLGDSDNGKLIATGGQFAKDESYAFEINSAGLVEAQNLDTFQLPTYSPSPPVTTSSEFYMSSTTGMCQGNDEFKPDWAPLYNDYDLCCRNSWNQQKCFEAKPMEAFVSPLSDEPTSTPTALANTSPVLMAGDTSTFNPVTGSFTCKAAGMTCTIKCTSCNTITRVESGMTMEFPNKSTIIYSAERGTDDWPDDPSRLILVESSSSATANVISCDEGCTCNLVNNNVLGCGLKAKPTDVQSTQFAPSPVEAEPFNRSASMDPLSLFVKSSIVLVWTLVN